MIISYYRTKTLSVKKAMFLDSADEVFEAINYLLESVLSSNWNYGCPYIDLIERGYSATDYYTGSYQHLENGGSALLASIAEGIMVYTAALTLDNTSNLSADAIVNDVK